MKVIEQFDEEKHTLRVEVTDEDVLTHLNRAEQQVWYMGIRPSVRFLLLATMALSSGKPSTRPGGENGLAALACEHGMPPFLCDDCGPLGRAR